MKRIAIVIAVMVFASSIAFAAELSPDRSQVKLSNVPRACLDTGSAIANGYKYTCTKQDTSQQVWNELAVRSFEKDIFKAYSQPVPEQEKLVGLVVRQDWTLTSQQPVLTERNGVAVVEQVEQRQVHKYRYAKR